MHVSNVWNARISPQRVARSTIAAVILHLSNRADMDTSFANSCHDDTDELGVGAALGGQHPVVPSAEEQHGEARHRRGEADSEAEGP